MATSCGHGAVDMAYKVESLLECSVCLETLNDPRSLPCFHSFCKVCLENIVRTEREEAKSSKIEDFNCPTCRSVFHLKSNQEVAELPSSHYIRNLLEAVQLQNQAKHANCSRCNKQPAICRCLSCELFLCDECLAEHNSVRESWPGLGKNPCSVISTEELAKPENQTRIKSNKILFCNKHESKKLKFYCETCKELICRYCMDFIHTRPDHDCAPIEHIVEKRKESLQHSVSVLEKKLVSGNEVLQTISDAEKKLESNAQKVKDSITNEKERVKNLVWQHLEENAKKKCEMVDIVYNNTHKEIARKRNDMQSFVKEVEVSCEMAKSVSRRGSNFEIIESDEMVTRKLESLKDEEKTRILEVNGLEDPIEYIMNTIDVKQLQLMLELGDVKLKERGLAYINLARASKILQDKDEYIRQMVRWLDEYNFQWRLCYRASLDKADATAFHSKCDNKGPTVVLVQVGRFIFGGFTDKNWSEAARSTLEEESGKSFIFSLSNNDNLPPFQSFLRKSKKAIFQDSDCGAIFGLGRSDKGRDLYISGNAFSDLGHSYTLPQGYTVGSQKARSLLAGSFHFNPTEVEVFY